MDISNLPQSAPGRRALNPLVFTQINDVPENPRLGLGYHQLYDLTKPVTMIARLPDVTRIGDLITLYWDGVDRQSYLLDQPTIDKGWLSFSLSPEFIRDPQGTVYYTLYDHQADDLQTSAPRAIRVKRLVPGGLDPDLDTAFNDALLPATITPAYIPSPDTAVTVTVPAWVNMEPGDELTVLWNHIRVDQPTLGPIGQPQPVSIPRAVLEQGGGSEMLLVEYEIRDIVDNYSLVSQPAYANADIDPDAVNAPRVMEADPITNILDLDQLGNNDAHVRIPHYTGIALNDSVTLTWTGRTPDFEVTPILNPNPKPVLDPDFAFVEFTIPNAEVKTIAGGSARVFYSVRRAGGGADLRSKSSTVSISGKLVLLEAPTIDEANGTATIDLSQLQGPTVTVRIRAYPGQQVGDIVYLTWSGAAPSGTPVNYTAEQRVASNQDVILSVSRNNLDPLAGGTLTLTYQVKYLSTGVTTQDQTLTIHETAANNATVEIFDGTTFLDTTTVSPTGTWQKTLAGLTPKTYSLTAQSAGLTSTPPWTFTIQASAVRPAISRVSGASGDVANGGTTQDRNLTIHGTAGNNAVVEIFDGSTSLGTTNASATGAWERTLNGLAVKTYSLTAQSAGLTSTPAWTFTVQAAAVRPVINRLTGTSGDVPNGGTTPDRNLTVHGTAGNNAVVEIFDSLASLGTATASATGVWQKPLTNLALGAHSLTAQSAGLTSTPPWLFSIGETLDLIPPRVKEAYGPNGDRLKMDDIYESAYVTVIVPRYPGMAAGQTVRVRWAGFINYDTEVRDVMTPGEMEFRVPRMEVIDVIGRSVTVNYTVKLPGNPTIIASKALTLHVDPQPIALPPPTISADNSRVTVDYRPNMVAGQTARVRWLGVTPHDTGEQDVKANTPEAFTIPISWINENRGKEVLINYTILRRVGNERLLFSRVLRKMIS